MFSENEPNDISPFSTNSTFNPNSTNAVNINSSTTAEPTIIPRKRLNSKASISSSSLAGFSGKEEISTQENIPVSQRSASTNLTSTDGVESAYNKLQESQISTIIPAQDNDVNSKTSEPNKNANLLKTLEFDEPRNTEDLTHDNGGRRKSSLPTLVFSPETPPPIQTNNTNYNNNNNKVEFVLGSGNDNMNAKKLLKKINSNNNHKGTITSSGLGFRNEHFQDEKLLVTNGNNFNSNNNNNSNGMAAAAAGMNINNSHSSSLLSAEENFECYADGTESFFDSPSENTSLQISRDANDLSISETSASGGPSNNNSNNINNNSSLPGSSSGLPFRRNSALRTSLRKSPQNNSDMGHRRWGSFRNTSGTKRPLTSTPTSSNALATQLYRTSSFNSTGRSSAGDAEEMYSDGSLEDEVIDLTQKVHHLEEKFTVLAENQNDVDDRYTRAKQENSELSTKLFLLEEQLRDVEQRAQDKLKDEQKRAKEALLRLDREKQLQIENYDIRLQSAEKELEVSKSEANRHKQMLDRERTERLQTYDKLIETERERNELREDNRNLAEQGRKERENLVQESAGSHQALQELKNEIENLRRFQMANIPLNGLHNRESLDGGIVDVNEIRSRLAELEEENKLIKQQNKDLEEANDDLTAQILNHGLEEGRHLLTLSPKDLGNSLAAELDAMSQDQMKSALKEQKEVNDQLRNYIDGILLNIVENYPQLLEVKNKSNNNNNQNSHDNKQQLRGQRTEP